MHLHGCRIHDSDRGLDGQVLYPFTGHRVVHVAWSTEAGLVGEDIEIATAGRHLSFEVPLRAMIHVPTT